MAQNQRAYDNEFKAQAVKLAREIGGHKAANELGIPKGTMYTWIKAFKERRLSANEAVHTPKRCMYPYLKEYTFDMGHIPLRLFHLLIDLRKACFLLPYHLH